MGFFGRILTAVYVAWLVVQFMAHLRSTLFLTDKFRHGGVDKDAPRSRMSGAISPVTLAPHCAPDRPGNSSVADESFLRQISSQLRHQSLTRSSSDPGGQHEHRHASCCRCFLKFFQNFIILFRKASHSGQWHRKCQFIFRSSPCLSLRYHHI